MSDLETNGLLCKIQRKFYSNESYIKCIPHNSSYTHHFQEDPHKVLKRDIACLYGYSSTPEKCDGVRDIAQFFFNPLGAIIEAAKGTKWEDTKDYQAEKEARLEMEKEVDYLQTRINVLYDKLNPTFPVIALNNMQLKYLKKNFIRFKKVFSTSTFP